MPAHNDASGPGPNHPPAQLFHVSTVPHSNTTVVSFVPHQCTPGDIHAFLESTTFRPSLLKDDQTLVFDFGNHYMPPPRPSVANQICQEWETRRAAIIGAGRVGSSSTPQQVLQDLAERYRVFSGGWLLHRGRDVDAKWGEVVWMIFRVLRSGSATLMPLKRGPRGGGVRAISVNFENYRDWRWVLRVREIMGENLDISGKGLPVKIDLLHVLRMDSDVVKKLKFKGLTRSSLCYAAYDKKTKITKIKWKAR